jgi:chromosomal replication initiator protein
MNLHELWKKALEQLEPLVSQVVYDSIILSIVPISFDGDIFTLDIQDSFHKPTIMGRYHRDITHIIRGLTHEDVEVQITCPHDITASESKSEDSLNYAKTNLRSRYRFSSFVSGPSTRMAFSASQSVASDPDKSQYNPLFLYGRVGLGKTHLLHSIGNHIHDKFPNKKILYVSADTFTEEFVNALQFKSINDFKKKYRSLDVLLIDDVQFLKGRKETQEELFHTFNIMHSSNKQIVISSDVAPKDLVDLEKRLVSRFESGLSADVGEPDYETRMAILKDKLSSEPFDMPPSVKDFIAQNITTNIRELEGAINKVMAYTRFSGTKLTLETAQEALKDHVNAANRPAITMPFIRDVVAAHFKLSIEDLCSRKRTANIVLPRQIAMYLCRKIMDVSQPDVGKFFGGRDHTTVIHSCDKITNEMEMDEKLKLVVDELEDKIKGI